MTAVSEKSVDSPDIFPLLLRIFVAVSLDYFLLSQPH